MFEFVQRIIVPIGGVIGGLVEYNAMKTVSMGNQEWKVKPQTASINSNEKDGIVININVDAKNKLMKVDGIMDLYGILVHWNLNVINYVMLVNA